MIFVIGLVSYLIAKGAIEVWGGRHVDNTVDKFFIPIGLAGFVLMVGSVGYKVCYTIISFEILP